MPIYLRNFYFTKFLESKKEEKKQIEKSTNKVKIPKPNFQSKFSR